jgi:hypothetical protein
MMITAVLFVLLLYLLFVMFERTEISRMCSRN